MGKSYTGQAKTVNTWWLLTPKKELVKVLLEATDNDKMIIVGNRQ